MICVMYFKSLPLPPLRRDARVVEEARLESVYICQRVSRVRIPVSPHSSETRSCSGFYRSKNLLLLALTIYINILVVMRKFGDSRTGFRMTLML